MPNRQYREIKVLDSFLCVFVFFIFALSHDGIIKLYIKRHFRDSTSNCVV